MNWNVVEENWKQYVGSVKTQWSKLTDDHISAIAGQREHLAGKIQEAYGIGIDEAEKQIKAFENLYKI
ncbi:MAG TPA: CsbD family protein [Burkholderiaceae bacterium]